MRNALDDGPDLRSVAVYTSAQRALRSLTPEHAPAGRSILVSILIVNYRAYEELASCLDSLRPFLTDDLEVIVVDHLSEAVATARLLERFSWIQLISVSTNPGFAAGVNRAARSASGRHFLLLNPDCIVDGDVVHVLAEWLDEHARVAAAGSLVRESDGSVQASARRFPNFTTGFAGRTSWLSRVWPANPWTLRNLVARGDLRDPVEVDWVSGACMMVRREAFEAVGGMDEKFFLYWEDADLCLRLQRAGWLTVYNPAVGITHFTGRSSALAQKASLIAFHRSAFRFYFKHGGRFGRLVSPLVFLALYARLFIKLGSLELGRTSAR
jgi:N-acetylglucosaminyl-diphospho-decaprenol L-rhamnosyltransferase